MNQGTNNVDRDDAASAGESMTLEWKKSLSEINEIIETATAFANTEGGMILVGMSPDGRPVGVQIGAGTIEQLVNHIAQNTDPKLHPRVTTKKVNNTQLIVIEVHESPDHLTLAFGRPYKRVGRSTVRMSKDEYEHLIIDKNRDRVRFDAQVCKGATIRDIRRELVREFIGKGKSGRGLALGERSSVHEALMRLRLLRGEKPTNAAILLFGAPQEFYPQCEVKCLRFKGLDVTGDMLDLKAVTGSVIHQLNDVEKFIYDHIALAAWIESGKMERQEKWEFPPKAIREVLANAIAHRDYRDSAAAQVRIFDDRIEVWNPGRLPAGWTAETFLRKHESVPPNPLIARQFFWVKYVEEVGSGTNKIVKWCREWGLPNPVFEYTGTSIVVTLRKRLADYAQVYAGASPHLGLVDRLVDGLVASQRKMILLMAEQPSVSKKQMANSLGISTTAIDKNIVQLKRKGFLRRVGPDKGGHWEVVKK